MRKLMLLGLTLILAAVWTVPVMADKLQDVQQQKSSIDAQINSVLRKKKEILSQKSQLESQKKNLADQANKSDEEYKKLLEEISDINGQIEKLDVAIAESEANYSKQQELLKARLRVMYENSNSSLIENLIRSENFTDFLERLELMSLVSRRNQQVIDEYEIAKLDVEYKKKLKEEEKSKVQKEAKEKQDQLNVLLASRSDIEDKIRKSKAELNTLEAKEDALIKQSEEFVNIIKSLQKTNSKYAGGSMTWPVPSAHRVVSPYGMRRHPILKKNKMHTGIDIDGKSGVSIVAANKGTVVLAGWQSGYGNTVVIDHGGGITTLYAHASRLLVKKGQQVKAGETIAKVGSTGLSTGPHLHFEVRVNGKTRNPLEYVSP